MNRPRSDPGGGPSDRQLAELTRFLARVCVEVERGLRPAAALARFADPTIVGDWPDHIRVGRFPGGPVQPGDIRRPQLSRLTDRVVHAAVTTRTSPGRWGALTLELAGRHGRWTIVRLQRLRTATRYRTGPDDLVPAGPSLEQRIAQASNQRRLVAAALHATRDRLDQLPAGATRSDTHQLVASWQRIAGQLDRELADLHTRLDCGGQPARSAGRDNPHPTSPPRSISPRPCGCSAAGRHGSRCWHMWTSSGYRTRSAWS